MMAKILGVLDDIAHAIRIMSTCSAAMLTVLLVAFYPN